MNFKQVIKDSFNSWVFVNPEEDKKAVLSAMISRSFNLSDCISKIEINSDKIETFLEKNLFQYNHASIADLGNLTIFISNIGWITSLMLKDTPLFNGQETSTRVILGSREMCLEADNNYLENHKFWWNTFDFLNKNIEKKVYKFDDIRWSMPGTYRTSIIINCSARVLARQIDMLSEIPECSDLVYTLKENFKAASPCLFHALTNKKRIPHKRWKEISILEVDNITDIQITPPSDLKYKFKQYIFSKRIVGKTMLDDTLSFLGLFNIKIQTTIIVARDWTRHRTWHPFLFKLLTKNGKPFLDENINIPEEIKNDINSKFDVIHNDVINIYDLYKYPVGTMVEIEASASLNFLIYALELRLYASGADKNYAKTAKKGIEILKKILLDNDIDPDYFLLL